MSRADLALVGVSAGARQFRVAASATRFYAGEPINFLGTYSSGAANVNTVVVLTDGKPIIGTDSFVGIAAQDVAVDTSAVVTAQKVYVDVPLPYSTMIRGRAKSATAIDTDTELLGILWDYVLFDLTAAVYTIDQAAAGNTSGLTIQNGNIALGTLDVYVDARAMRISIS